MSEGNGHAEEFNTPTDPPPLVENVPYIQALAPLVLQLSALVTNVGEVVHELRIARKPIEETGLVAKLRSAFQTLKAIGGAGEQAFKEGA